MRVYLTWLIFENNRVVSRCYQQFFWYRYFAGIRFIWRSVFPVDFSNLAGTPFFRKRGAGFIKKGAGAPFFLKKGAIAPFLREIGFPAKKIIPKCTDQDFLRYRYGKYQEIPTDTNRKIPIRHTTLIFYHDNPHARGISTAEKLCVMFGQVLFFAMICLWPQNKNV